MMFLSLSNRPISCWGAHELQGLHITGVIRQRYHKDIWQLPVLQPTRLALLPLCWSTGELLCPETASLEDQKIILRWSLQISEKAVHPTVLPWDAQGTKLRDCARLSPFTRVAWLYLSCCVTGGLFTDHKPEVLFMLLRVCQQIRTAVKILPFIGGNVAFGYDKDFLSSMYFVGPADTRSVIFAFFFPDVPNKQRVQQGTRQAWYLKTKAIQCVLCKVTPIPILKECPVRTVYFLRATRIENCLT